jgi:signal transduction histidine kinase
VASKRRAEIENRRSRLLGTVFVMLAAFAGFSVALSFLGPDIVAPLQETPVGARVGVLLLVGGFLALVWEKERELRHMAETLDRQRVVAASSANRLKVIEALLESGDRLAGPLLMDDVMRVVVEAALDLVGSNRGWIELVSERAPGELSVLRRYPSGHVDKRGPGMRLPLRSGSTLIAILDLAIPADSVTKEELEALDRFAEQAGKALERARVLSEQRASVGHLQAASAVRSRLLATVSHSLLTPLTPIIGYAATLESHWGRLRDAQRKEYLSVIQDQGWRMRRQVNRLLDAARIELEGLTINPVEHDIRETVGNALKVFATQRKRLAIDLPDSSIEAELDPFVVEEIISNLVDNALKYSKRQVSVRLDADAHLVSITVADSGPGMSLAEQRLLMEAPSGLEEQDSGDTGFGLHVVGTLVRDHGGRCLVKASERGTAVTVALPRTTARRERRKEGMGGSTRGRSRERA